MTEPSVQAVERVLAEHVYELTHRTGACCRCGFVAAVDPETLQTMQDYHRAHVAAKVAEALCDDLSRSEGKSSELCDSETQSHTAAQATEGASRQRPSSKRDGECICDYGPNTDGPDECCPFHGRPYAYWIERGDTLQERLLAARPSDLENRVRELADEIRAEVRLSDEQLGTSWANDDYRSGMESALRQMTERATLPARGDQR